MKPMHELTNSKSKRERETLWTSYDTQIPSLNVNMKPMCIANCVGVNPRTPLVKMRITSMYSQGLS
jgi:hypothetical protein